MQSCDFYKIGFLGLCKVGIFRRLAFWVYVMVMQVEIGKLGIWEFEN